MYDAKTRENKRKKVKVTSKHGKWANED